MVDNFRHAQYADFGEAQIDDPQSIYPLATFAATSYTSRLTHRLAGAFGQYAYSRTGAGTPASTIIDCNGLMQKTLQNEARFKKARRICNLLIDTETFTTNWVPGANTTGAQQLALRSPNHGRPSRYKFTRTAGSANMLSVASASYQAGTHTFSAWVFGDGTTQWRIRIERTSDSVGSEQLVTPVAGVATRIWVSHLLDTTPYRMFITAVAVGAAVLDVCDPQFEYTQGHGLPGDYVPRGVPNFPAKLIADECNVDGVRYFNTVNPWSDAGGGIAVKATNSVLLPTPPGLLLEPTATGRFLSSGDVGAAAWTAGLVGMIPAAQFNSTLLGVNGLRKMDETAVTSNHQDSQNWFGSLPPNNTIISLSGNFKAAERSIVRLFIINKQGATAEAYFNLVSMTVSNITGTNVEALIKLEGDTVKCGLSCNSGTGASTPSAGFGTALVAGTASYLGVVTNGVYVGAMQFERNDTPTSYVGDSTGATVYTRDADFFTETTGAFPSINFSVELTVTPEFRTDIANKSGWYYWMYAYMNAEARLGVGLRPGLFGGGSTATYGNNWWVDQFNDSPYWDGLALQNSVVANPDDPVHLQFGMLPYAVTGDSNLVGYVGGVRVPTSNEIGVLTTPAKVDRMKRNHWIWYFGRANPNSLVTAPFCLRDISYRVPGLTNDEMAANA